MEDIFLFSIHFQNAGWQNRIIDCKSAIQNLALSKDEIDRKKLKKY